MKTMKKLFFSVLIVSLSSGLIFAGTSTALQKTYTWKYNINKDGTVKFDNYDCNLTIHIWDKAEAEYHMMVDAKTRSDEDAVVLDKYLQELKFSNSATMVSFRDVFWETRNNILGRMTMKLEGGKSISLTEMSMKGELWIPATCHLELESKYSEVNMEDFSGTLSLDLYSDTYYGGKLSGKTDIVDKYSTMEFKDMKDMKADLYSSKLEAANLGNLNIVSKYSKFTAASAGRVDIDAYSDKFEINRTGDIKFVGKYSDLKTDVAGQLELDCYEGTIVINEAKDIKMTSKYADFQFGSVGNVTVTSSYSDKFSAGKLTTLKISDSKYCNYKVDELTSSVTESDGYEDKFHIMKTGNELKEVNIDGKYIEIELMIPKTLDYRFRARIQYPKLDMNESALKSRVKIVQGDQVEYDAVKGIEKEGMPLISVTGYEMSLKITEM